MRATFGMIYVGNVIAIFRILYTFSGHFRSKASSVAGEVAENDGITAFGNISAGGVAQLQAALSWSDKKNAIKSEKVLFSS